MIARKRHAAVFSLAMLAWLGTPGHAEQFEQFGAWRVYYIAFNASLLSPQLAERYGIVRGRSKGLLNISALRASGHGEKIALRGRFRNLLGQAQALAFRTVEDNGSVYYLAAFDFENAETLRFEIELELPDHGTATLRFQQPLYFPVP